MASRIPKFLNKFHMLEILLFGLTDNFFFLDSYGISPVQPIVLGKKFCWISIDTSLLMGMILENSILEVDKFP